VSNLFKKLQNVVMLIAVAGLLFVSIAPAHAATPGHIVLYEGNGGSQDIVRTYTYTDTGLATKVRPNDEARSLKLLNVRAGAVITVYDDKKGSTRDDFCVIRVKKTSPEYTVGTFERSYEDEYVTVSFGRKNGLDGKVSFIVIK
jgi:hypothetical protein